MQGKSLKVRLLLDHSCVEVFTEFGQSLSTRIYRADSPQGADERLHVFSMAGPAKASSISVHTMRSIWKVEQK